MDILIRDDTCASARKEIEEAGFVIEDNVPPVGALEDTGVFSREDDHNLTCNKQDEGMYPHFRAVSTPICLFKGMYGNRMFQVVLRRVDRHMSYYAHAYWDGERCCSYCGNDTEDRNECGECNVCGGC
jgi:hypothetical protein